MSTALLLLLGGAPVAPPQVSPPTPPVIYVPPTPDPARLEEARRLMVVLDPDTVKRQTRDKLAFILAEKIMESVRQDSGFRSLGSQALPPIQRFMDRQKALVDQDLSKAWPIIVEAEAKVYAVRLTVRQMKATEDFLSTDAGQRYLGAAAAATNDPATAAITTALLRQGVMRETQEIAALRADLAAASKRDTHDEH